MDELLDLVRENRFATPVLVSLAGGAVGLVLGLILPSPDFRVQVEPKRSVVLEFLGGVFLVIILSFFIVGLVAKSTLSCVGFLF